MMPDAEGSQAPSELHHVAGIEVGVRKDQDGVLHQRRVDLLRQLIGDIAWFGRKDCDRAEGRRESSARELHERRLEARWKLREEAGRRTCASCGS
jgi:hypothetical protein